MRFSTILDNATDADEEPTSLLQRTRQLQCLGTTTVEMVSFWTAVVLPAPTILLLTVGVGTRMELVTVTGLLCGNLLALYLGHDYSGSRTDQQPPDG